MIILCTIILNETKFDWKYWLQIAISIVAIILQVIALIYGVL